MKRLNTAIAILLLCMLAVGCGSGSSSNKANNEESGNNTPPSQEQNGGETAAPGPSNDEESPAEPQETPLPDPLLERLAEMTIEEKIGQLVITGLSGTSMQQDAVQMVNDYKVGGFILYRDNIQDADQTVALLNELKAANSDNAVALWLGADQEGGRVHRLPKEYIKMPSAREIGKANNITYTFEVGKALGTGLKSLGFNIDFAPVLDIDSNPDNPVIGDRSFGTTAEAVTKHGIETMKGIQSEGIATVVKHFPGHGDTHVDSHKALPVVNKSIAELEKLELVPFAEAVKQQADSIMVAHLLIPEIDDEMPASLSHELITGLLRNNWQYDGVIMTDDLTMGGITNGFTVAEAAVKAIQAGNDLLIIGHNAKQQLGALQALRQSVDDGSITEERLDESVYRILRLKMRYGVEDEPTPEADVKELNRTLAEQLEKALADR